MTPRVPPARRGDQRVRGTPMPGLGVFTSPLLAGDGVQASCQPLCAHLAGCLVAPWGCLGTPPCCPCPWGTSLEWGGFAQWLCSGDRKGPSYCSGTASWHDAQIPGDIAGQGPGPECWPLPSGLSLVPGHTPWPLPLLGCSPVPPGPLDSAVALTWGHLVPVHRWRSQCRIP